MVRREKKYSFMRYEESLIIMKSIYHSYLVFNLLLLHQHEVDNYVIKLCTETDHIWSA